MVFPFVKKQTPESHSWELVFQTQSDEHDATSLLFVNEVGDFKTVEMKGKSERGLDYYIKFFNQTGLQSTTVEKDGKKIMIVQIPETKLPAKHVQTAPTKEGVSVTRPAPNMASQS